MTAQLEPANRDVRALQARYRKESAAANQRDARMFKAMFAKMAALPDRDAAPAPPAPAAEHIPDSAPADGPASHPVDVAAEGGAMGDAAEVLEAQHSAPQQNGHAHTQGAPQPMAVDSVA